MPPRYVVIHKVRGETPLGAVERWKSAHPRFLRTPACYAGRLDPMAEGKLLVLLGDECKKQKKYTKLDKEYEIEILLDLTTDTGDALGLPSYAGIVSTPPQAALRAAVASTLGTHSVPYPAFSSKTVNVKPLFLYALEGTLGTIQIPEHDETIYRAKILSSRSLSVAELSLTLARLLERVPRSEETSKRLGEDFRQELIRAGWRALFNTMSERQFTLVRLRVSCASGSYMRTLAGRIAKELGTTGLALTIKRTRIGKLSTLGPLRFWTKSY